MKFNGERYIPEPGDENVELSVEHQLRYHAVAAALTGKRVLDAACGEGYGAARIAEDAAEVVGLDISDEAVGHARAAYRRSNLTFLQGSVEKLPFPDESFDAIVSFETIEHVDEDVQRAFLVEARRVLRRDGVLVISTPDRRVYSDSVGHINEFHVKEFYREEFVSFLSSQFPSVELFGQQAVLATALHRYESEILRRIHLSSAPVSDAKYLVAVCQSGAATPIDLSAIVLDTSQTYERWRDRILELQREVEDRNVWAQGLKEELEERTRWCQRLDSEVRERNAWAQQLDEELRSERAQLTAMTAERDEARAEAQVLRDQSAALQQAFQELNQKMVSSELQLIYRNYRKLRDRSLPPFSGRRALVKRGYELFRGRMVGLKARLTERVALLSEPPEEKEPESYEPLAFELANEPLISIIIPTYNQWHYTYACLASLYKTLNSLPVEIIIADDGSSDLTCQAAEIVSGIKVVRDGMNRGFTRNCNHAAQYARGCYLHFLNNDTEVRPKAVQALVDLLEAEPGTGMVGSKLIYPDGRLQEAGGLVWKDGSAWNFGRLQDPEFSEFNYVRDVDYVSGASLMIRADLWRELGGFDERYAPAYCEDSDLAFAVRERGYAVRYQPRSVVVHYEGVSCGTDTAAGTKAYQVRNSRELRKKWQSVLERDHFPNAENVFVARDRSRHKKAVLVVDHYVPHFDKDAGSRTEWAFLRALVGMGMNVKFIGDNFFRHEPYTTALQQLGIEVLYGPHYGQKWSEWLAENGEFFDCVLLNRPHVAPKYLGAVRAHTQARVLYYGHDLAHVRELKRAEVEGSDELRRAAVVLKAQEQELMSRMDVVLTCSQDEAEIIRQLCPNTQVELIPPYAFNVDENLLFDAAARSGLLFVGGFSHTPNVDAVLNFSREVWPKIHARMPELVFTVAGSNPPPEVQALASESIRILGYVDDAQLAELYRNSRLVVVPLRYGAGVKGKTVEAMALGVPVVGTPTAFEGMAGIGEHLAPVQFSEAMETAVFALYNEPDKLEEISRNQRAYVAGRFSIEGIQDSFRRAMQENRVQARTA